MEKALKRKRGRPSKNLIVNFNNVDLEESEEGPEILDDEYYHALFTKDNKDPGSYNEVMESDSKYKLDFAVKYELNSVNKNKVGKFV